MGTAFHHIRSGSGLRREQYIIGCSLEPHRQEFGHKRYWPKVLDVHSSIQELVDRIRSARIVHTIPNVIETMRRPQRPPVQQDEVHDFSSHVLLGGRGFGLVDEQQGISFEMMDDEPVLSALEGSETLVLRTLLGLRRYLLPCCLVPQSYGSCTTRAHRSDSSLPLLPLHQPPSRYLYLPERMTLHSA